MQKMQTMRSDILILIMLLFTIFGCVQTVFLRRMICRYRDEQVENIVFMAAILVAMQSPKIREHSRRVSAMSEKLAGEMRLPLERMPFVRAAGLLHEIKEIGAIPGHLPIEAEILTVADYFDSVIYNFNEPKTMDDAVEDIRREAGTRYNPTVVKALMKFVRRSEGENSYDN